MLRRILLRIGLGEWAVLVILVIVVVLVLFLVVGGGEPGEDTPPLTATPVPTHTLDVVAVPAEAADFRLAPKPGDRGAYTAGTTVTIHALPREGWQVQKREDRHGFQRFCAV